MPETPAPDGPPLRDDPVADPDPAGSPTGGHPGKPPEQSNDQFVGRVLGPVVIGPVAHGGHCVARYEGRVIFVRHTIPGERVMVKITDAGRSRYWRADAVEVVQPGPDRVVPPCPIARPGACGGCDFQHVELAAQRRLKSEVLGEQLRRLAGLDLQVPVEAVPLPGSAERSGEGLGWRTRMRYLYDDHGQPGLRAHRSHRVIPLPADGCRIAAAGIGRPPAGEPGTELVAVAAPDGPHWLAAGGRPAVGRDPAPEPITERAAGRDWRVPPDGFWQVHPAAADLLVAAVLEGLAPRPGEAAFDLYCGVGLFAGALADAGCRVTGVESARSAVAAARRNLADNRSKARFIADRVDRALRQPGGRGALPAAVDLVVLDPPRSGAGRDVVDGIVRRRPRAIAYVACDPAALARDLGHLRRQGYRLAALRAFDLFPMTHHVECVALLTKIGSDLR